MNETPDTKPGRCRHHQSDDNTDWQYCAECMTLRYSVKEPVTETPDYQAILRRLMFAYDADNEMEFVAACVTARHALGVVLADDHENATDSAVLAANGYTATGELK